MRKAILISFVVGGAAVGVLAAIGQTVGVKVVLGIIGAVAGVAIGGAIAGIANRRSTLSIADLQVLDDPIHDERERNYWLDRGRLTAAPGLPNPNDNDPHSQEP
jgi:hypothetical protein